MPIKNPDAICEVLKICSDHDYCDAVWWRCDSPEYNPVTFLVNCNDFFYPAADAEEVEEADIPEFKRAFEDCAALDKAVKLSDTYVIFHAPLLFVARKRKLRPWKRKFEHLAERVKPLFNNPDWPWAT